MQDFRKLGIWERSHSFTLKIYEATKDFPKEEVYGLVSQMRRSASSVPTNIAEGCGRNGDVEFARFLQIAYGSCCESAYQLILSRDLGFISTEVFDELSNELTQIQKMLSAFISRLKTKS